MGASKTEHYSATEIKMAKLAKALAHPARWRIVNLIADKGPTCCYQIMQILPLCQSTISQHLDVLHKCGVISPAYLFNETTYYYLAGISLTNLYEGVYDLYAQHHMDKNSS